MLGFCHFVLCMRVIVTKEKKRANVHKKCGEQNSKSLDCEIIEDD